MNSLMTRGGTLKINIESHHSDSEGIPKQLQILGPDLQVKESAWMEGRTWDHHLQSGVYLVRLNLASGKELEQIAEISDGQETNLDFDIGRFSPRETQEWVYLTKGNASPKAIGGFRSGESADAFVKVSAKRWTYIHNAWHSKVEPGIDGGFVDAVGETFILDVPYQMQVLEVKPEDKRPTFISLPPSRLQCMIKQAQGPESVVGNLDISLSTPNNRAQVLLSLMNSGDMTKAKSLVSVQDAERVLYQKIIDPAGAAIGGYFLLKTGELDRLHDWANNLANWFEWMPDGAVIHGWQLIHQGASQSTITTIRKRFIEAVNRGIPIYSEGLRLLYEGLMMLSYEYKKEDRAVEHALARVKRYIGAADLSQENSTFTGSYPDEPGINASDSASDSIRPVEPINIH